MMFECWSAGWSEPWRLVSRSLVISLVYRMVQKNFPKIFFPKSNQIKSLGSPYGYKLWIHWHSHRETRFVCLAVIQLYPSIHKDQKVLIWIIKMSAGKFLSHHHHHWDDDWAIIALVSRAGKKPKKRDTFKCVLLLRLIGIFFSPLLFS